MRDQDCGFLSASRQLWTEHSAQEFLLFAFIGKSLLLVRLGRTGETRFMEETEAEWRDAGLRRELHLMLCLCPLYLQVPSEEETS